VGSVQWGRSPWLAALIKAMVSLSLAARPLSVAVTVGGFALAYQ
jgi:hypothetical protein